MPTNLGCTGASLASCASITLLVLLPCCPTTARILRLVEMSGLLPGEEGSRHKNVRTPPPHDPPTEAAPQTLRPPEGCQGLGNHHRPDPPTPGVWTPQTMLKTRRPVLTSPRLKGLFGLQKAPWSKIATKGPNRKTNGDSDGVHLAVRQHAETLIGVGQAQPLHREESEYPLPESSSWGFKPSQQLSKEKRAHDTGDFQRHGSSPAVTRGRK